MESLEGQKMLCAASLNQGQHGVPNRNWEEKKDAAPIMEAVLLLVGDLGDDRCYPLENGEWKQIKCSQIPKGILSYAACLTKEGVLISGGYKNGTPTL